MGRVGLETSICALKSLPSGTWPRNASITRYLVVLELRRSMALHLLTRRLALCCWTVLPYDHDPIFGGSIGA